MAKNPRKPRKLDRTDKLILKTLQDDGRISNVALAKKIIQLAVAKVPPERGCACADALSTAIVTNLEKVSPRQKEKLGLIIAKYDKQV